MAKPKVNKEVVEEKILPPEGTGKTPAIKNVRAELLVLLQKKTPGIFDREPNSGFNGNIHKLVEEITNLFN